jgi:uncharacterized protein (TIGR02452 family)
MSRERRAQIARETLDILERGWYVAPSGQTVSLHEALANAAADTRLYLPHDYDILLGQVATVPSFSQTTIAVTRATTLGAAQALAAEYPTLACLNFASAKNPGGGFLSGSQAQEESLARASGLYSTLHSCRATVSAAIPA